MPLRLFCCPSSLFVESKRSHYLHYKTHQNSRTVRTCGQCSNVFFMYVSLKDADASVGPRGLLGSIVRRDMSRVDRFRVPPLLFSCLLLHGPMERSCQSSCAADSSIEVVHSAALSLQKHKIRVADLLGVKSEGSKPIPALDCAKDCREAENGLSDRALETSRAGGNSVAVIEKAHYQHHARTFLRSSWDAGPGPHESLGAALSNEGKKRSKQREVPSADVGGGGWVRRDAKTPSRRSPV